MVNIDFSVIIKALDANPKINHCDIGVGHIADKIEKLGQILNMEVVKIC